MRISVVRFTRRFGNLWNEFISVENIDTAGWDHAIKTTKQKGERQMNKLITSLCAITIAGMMFVPSYGANMCVQDDATMIVLDPIITGTSNGSNGTGKTWSTKFSYGIISGIAACADDCATKGCVATNQNMSVYSAGFLCYCKMLRPALSRWVYSGTRSSTHSNCASGCASYCASNVASEVAVRRGLYRSVGI